MKKLLLLILVLFSFVGTTFAIDLSFGTIKFETNDGIERLPDLNIDFGETKVNSFEIIINENDYIIFDNNLDDINIDDIGFDVSLKDSNKRAIFSGDFTGEVDIKGLYIRIFDREVRASLSINYEGDELADANFNGTIRVEDNDDNRDTMRPLAPSNLTYSMSGDFVLFNWTPSPDLDLDYGLIRLEKDGSFYKNIKIGAKDDYYKANLNLEDNNREIMISVRDRYYTSETISLEIIREVEAYCIKNMRLARNPETNECKAFYNTCDVPEEWDIVEDCSVYEQEEETVFCMPVEQAAKNLETNECKVFDTLCDVPDSWKKVDNCDVTKLLDKKLYIYIISSFSVFQTKFDQMIDKKIREFTIEKKNEVIEIRNNIMLVLKNFETGVITKETTIKKLKILIKSYIDSIK